MSEARPDTLTVGSLVVVLGWVQPCGIPAPYTGPVQVAPFKGGECGVRVAPSQGVRQTRGNGVVVNGWWVASWRLPTPAELAAYQLARLTEGGL